MKSILPLACTAALVLFATRAPLRAQSSVQRRYIYSISINPVALTASQPQSVVVGARVSADSALITDGVVLNEYDINGKALRSLGRMYDDGTHGDAVANDSVFTTTVTLTESAPVLLEVSASYRGSLRRVMSRMQLPVITGSPTGLSTLSLIADALDRGDVDTALANTHISPDDTAVIRSLSAADRSRFATFLRAATIESGDGEYQTLRSGGRQLFMHHSSSGNWFLISW